VFAIVKDMNFHPQFERPNTSQRIKTSDDSPMKKRIRLTSPSPVKKPFIEPKANTKTLTDIVIENEVDLFIFKYKINIKGFFIGYFC